MPDGKKFTRLIVDADSKFTNTLSEESQKATESVKIVRSGREAQLTLADQRNEFLAIFVNPALPGGYGPSVIRFAHRYRPATPIYLIFDENNAPAGKSDMDQLGVQDCLKKPLTLQNFIDLPKAGAASFNPARALSVRSLNSDTLDTEIGADDKAFLPILAKTLVSGSISYFDIYVRITSGRYVMILRAGDSFSVDRINSYLSKGVKYFYLRREAQEVYLNYCDRIASAINSSEKVSWDVQVSQTLNHGREVMKYLDLKGVDSTYLQYANRFVNNVNQLISNTRPKDNSYLDSFLSNLEAAEHATGVTLVASMLGRSLGMDSANPVKAIGMAGMLHDIGVQQLPLEIQGLNEDLSKMSPLQAMEFKKHPIIGSEILRSFKEMNPSVVQAVIQHHERRDRSGYPYQLGPGEINRIAEIIGLSDLFVQNVKNLITQSGSDPVDETLKTAPLHYSYQLVEAFKDLMNKKK